MCKLILGSLVTLPAALIILLLHETPHWLVKKGRHDNARYITLNIGQSSHGMTCVPQAIERLVVLRFHHGLNYRLSMIFYRGKGHREWERELQSIIEQAEQSDSQNKITIHGILQVLMSPAFLKPFRCIGILEIMYMMSGISLITTYTNTFLEVSNPYFGLRHYQLLILMDS